MQVYARKAASVQREAERESEREPGISVLRCSSLQQYTSPGSLVRARGADCLAPLCPSFPLLLFLKRGVLMMLSFITPGEERETSCRFSKKKKKPCREPVVPITFYSESLPACWFAFFPSVSVVNHFSLIVQAAAFLSHATAHSPSPHPRAVSDHIFVSRI